MTSGSPLPVRQPVARLPLIGTAYAGKLARLHIHTGHDLLHHYPYRYQDASLTGSISSLRVGETITLTGMVLSITSSYLRSGKTIQKAVFTDGTGTIPLTWFNQPYLVTALTQKPHLSITGTVKVFKGKPALTAPQFEFMTNRPESAATIHTGRLIPIYPETAGVSSKWIRSRIHALLQKLPPFPEWLPAELISSHQLFDYDRALRQIHFPDSSQAAQQACRRLSFDELFIWQILAQLRKLVRIGTANHYQTAADPALLAPIIDQLPFQLTSAQNRVIREILTDLNQPQIMNRLVQGDVGSGKTIVATLAIYAMHQAGYRSVFMAPTEILAHQHLKTVTALLEPLGLKVAAASKTYKEDLTSADVVIGTHAVLHRQLPEQIGLVIIDEQHRFGVRQRSQLLDTPRPPHLLSMTATPIPRTIALTLYAELDVSVIDEMPKDRLPVKTRVVPDTKRPEAYTWLEQQVTAGHQIYVVCPLVEDSEAEGMAQVKAAETEYARLKDEIFPKLRLGLVHGQMKSKDKDAAIGAFAAGQTDILVATSVIEVGIDIPTASIMVIEAAERFGLAQLHQLRGRVGRGTRQSFCLLFPGSNQPQARSRLNHLEKIHSGFELANLDLKLRGPGDVYGLRQSGYIDLKIATLDDEELIRATHQAAASLIQSDPHLKNHPDIREKVDSLKNSLIAPN
jgi:ATP-dependent DNA helicase RecG